MADILSVQKEPGAVPAATALSLLPAAWEQGVAEGPARSSHSSGELQGAGAVGKQEATFLPRHSGLNRPFKQSLLPALKYIENSEAECNCHPCKLFYEGDAHRSEPLPNFQCLL